MTATVLDHESYEAYRDDMFRHCCEDLELSFADWCTACREES